MVLVATGKYNSKHLLIAYSVVSLCWPHALRPKGNQVPVAFIGATIPIMHSAFCAAANLVLLLQDDASCSKTRDIHLETNWPDWIEVG
jgi:hypothetical protein